MEHRERLTCEKCLKRQISIRADGIKYYGCACGHTTPSQTARILNVLIANFGKELIEGAIIGELRQKLEGVSSFPACPIPSMSIRVPVNKLFENTVIDVEEFIPVGEIERAGTPALRMLIEQERQDLKEVLGQDAGFAVAAAAVAYSYDRKTGKCAEKVIQKISDSGLKEFYLGPGVGAGSRPLLAENHTDRVIEIMGNAKYEMVEKGIYYTVKIADPSYPLILAYYPNDMWNSKLFVFL
jgi:hypothetical protein